MPNYLLVRAEIIGFVALIFINVWNSFVTYCELILVLVWELKEVALPIIIYQVYNN